MNCWARIAGAGILVGTLLLTLLISQTTRSTQASGPYALIGLRPRADLAAILDERADQTLSDKVNGLISKMTVETLNLRPNCW